MFLRAFLMIVLASSLGCGGNAADAPSGLVHASGSINFNGEPVPKGTISFVPEGEGTRVSADIVDGQFELNYSASAKGAQPGAYKVGVVAVEGEATMDEEGNPVEAKELVPATFGDPETSGIKLTVPEGGSSDLIIDISG